MIDRQKLIKVLIITAIVSSLILCAETIFHQCVPTLDLENIQTRYIRRGIPYIFLNILYVFWLFLMLRQKNQKESHSYNFRDILKVTLPFLLIAYIAYPQTSDIYLYLQYGLMNLNGINPFLHTAKQFTSEFTPLIVWDSRSAYGPIAQIIFIISAYFTKINIILSVYIFKIICLFFHIINGYLVWRLLNCFNYRNLLATAYLVNPVLLFDTVSNAHLDVFVCTSFILFFMCFKFHRYILSILAIWMGLLVKILPMFWLPLVLVFLIRQRRWKTLLIAVCISLSIIIFLSLIFLPSNKAWLSLLNPGVAWSTAGSLHNIVGVILKNSQGFLPDLISGDKNYRVVMPLRLLTYICYITFYITILFKVYFIPNYSPINLIVDIGWATLFLFLFATPWFQPWYVAVLIPMIVLNFPIIKLNIDAFLFVTVAFIYSLSSASYYLLAIPKAHSFFFATVSLITIVPPIIFLVYGKKLFLQSKI